MKRRNLAIIILSLIITFHLSFLSFERSHEPNLVIKKAGFWELSEIYIEDDDPLKNWAITAATEPWCSGSGTWIDPFIIENVTINGLNSGSCITIYDSNAYFIIRNCTVYNSGNNLPSLDSGIKIKNSENGKIFNNTCRNNNGFGISFEDANNCTAEQNTVENNDWSGFFLNIEYDNVNCDNNQITNNNITYNDEYGIYIDGNYNPSVTDIKFNLISNNNISYNGLDGIRIRLSEYNTISNNRIYNNTKNGISIRSVGLDTIYNQIVGNIIYNNTEYGIENIARLTEISGVNLISENLYAIRNYGDDTIIYNNSFFNNKLYGVVIADSSDNNNIYANNFTFNPINAYDYSSSTQWDNGVSGNYWSNYIGLDANDDGFGDTPYDVLPLSGSMDHYPIYSDGNDIGPTITIIDPTSDEVFGDEPPIYNITIFDIHGIDKVWYTLDNGITNYTASVLIDQINQVAWNSLTSGQVTLKFYANDSSGLMGTAELNFQKDVNSPELNILYPFSNQILGINTPEYIIEYNETNIDTLWYAVNSGSNYTFSSNSSFDATEWRNIENGSVVITFYANDTLGNEISAKINVWKDALIPEIIINTPSSVLVYDESPPDYNINVIEQHLDTIWYTIGNIGINFSITTNGTLDFDLWDQLLNGTHELMFYANDSAGNFGSVSVFIKKDILSPIITIIDPSINDVFGSIAPAFQIDVSEGHLDKMWYILNDGARNFIFDKIGLIDQILWDNLTNGQVTIKFYANDTQGNTNFAQITILKDIGLSTQQPTMFDIIFSPFAIIGYIFSFGIGISMMFLIRKIKLRTKS